MSSIRSYGRRVGSLFAVAALALATITPGLVPSFASAAQLTERSIALSSSSAAATGVSYSVGFTSGADAAAGSLIIDFCSNSPLIGAVCDSPAGFTSAGVASSGGFTATSVDANTVRVVGTVATEDEISFTLTGMQNPTDPGALYARIVTYSDTDSTNYTNAQNLGAGTVDNGGAAISITDSINVRGAVLETLTFCVAGPGYDGNNDPVATVIADGCDNSTTPGDPLPAPTLQLGKKSGSVIALDSSEVSTGSLYSQISTNASKGAIVSLKSDAAGCGGLLRAGSGAGSPTNCDIAPAGTSDITDGQAKFGAKVTPTAGGEGTLLGLNSYNASTFVLNYNATDQSTGVTSTYGDPFFSTSDLPASNKNITLTFGASVAPNTPAGNYSAGLSLIATGKF